MIDAPTSLVLELHYEAVCCTDYEYMVDEYGEL